jgi:hypothetical protein
MWTLSSELLRRFLRFRITDEYRSHRVTQKVVAGVYQGVTTTELDVNSLSD